MHNSVRYNTGEGVHRATHLGLGVFHSSAMSAVLFGIGYMATTVCLVAVVSCNSLGAWLGKLKNKIGVSVNLEQQKDKVVPFPAGHQWRGRIERRQPGMQGTCTTTTARCRSLSPASSHPCTTTLATTTSS